MTDQFVDKPILNSPYEFPTQHWEFYKTGQPTNRIINKRRRVEFWPAHDLQRLLGCTEWRKIATVANDPYKSLRTTLKAEINEDAWATLHSDISRPLDKPESGRIAGKVINHLGDEVMKVCRVD